MDRKSIRKIYPEVFVTSSTVLVEQIPPRGHGVCFENGPKASINEAACRGLLGLLAAVITRTGRRVSSHLSLYFSSLVVACCTHRSFCATSIYPIDAGMSPWVLLRLLGDYVEHAVRFCARSPSFRKRCVCAPSGGPQGLGKATALIPGQICHSQYKGLFHSN